MLVLPFARSVHSELSETFPVDLFSSIQHGSTAFVKQRRQTDLNLQESGVDCDSGVTVSVARLSTGPGPSSREELMEDDLVRRPTPLPANLSCLEAENCTDSATTQSEPLQLETPETATSNQSTTNWSIFGGIGAVLTVGGAVFGSVARRRRSSRLSSEVC